jgi:hypothetical protein
MMKERRRREKKIKKVIEKKYRKIQELNCCTEIHSYT